MTFHSLGIDPPDYLNIPSWVYGVVIGVAVCWFRWRRKPRK